MNVEIYSKPNCKYCDMAKQLLNSKQIGYIEISAIENRDALIDRVSEATGQAPKSVPQIFIDNNHIGGYDQLVEWFAAEKPE